MGCDVHEWSDDQDPKEGEHRPRLASPHELGSKPRAEPLHEERDEHEKAQRRLLRVDPDEVDDVTGGDDQGREQEENGSGVTAGPPSDLHGFGSVVAGAAGEMASVDGDVVADLTWTSMPSSTS